MRTPKLLVTLLVIGMAVTGCSVGAAPTSKMPSKAPTASASSPSIAPAAPDLTLEQALAAWTLPAPPDGFRFPGKAGAVIIFTVSDKLTNSAVTTVLEQPCSAVATGLPIAISDTSSGDRVGFAALLIADTTEKQITGAVRKFESPAAAASWMTGMSASATTCAGEIDHLDFTSNSPDEIGWSNGFIVHRGALVFSLSVKGVPLDISGPYVLAASQYPNSLPPGG